MLIRTGILTIPAYDEAAVTALRSLLRSDLPGAMVMIDKGSEGKRYVVEEAASLERRGRDGSYLTVGGTRPALGPAAGERVPEATAAVAERALPGLAEAMRAAAGSSGTVEAWLDRGVTVIRGATLLSSNLPAGGAGCSGDIGRPRRIWWRWRWLWCGASRCLRQRSSILPGAPADERPAETPEAKGAGRKKGLQADEFWHS